MKKGKIIFIMGISGAGKGTLVDNLLRLNDDFIFSLSCKTRPKRDFEIDGKDAHFLTEEDFKKKIDNGEFLEYAYVHNGGYYGTLLKDVFDNGIYTGKNVISEIEVAGLKDVLENRPDLKEDMISIFLNIPDSEVENRLLKRGEEMSAEYLQNRLNSAQKERENFHLYDYVVDSHKNNEEEVLKIVLDLIKNK